MHQRLAAAQARQPHVGVQTAQLDLLSRCGQGEPAQQLGLVCGCRIAWPPTLAVAERMTAPSLKRSWPELNSVIAVSMPTP
jgi:hypothetical protein